MAHETHYEILVKQGGRWEIHARHDSANKGHAIEEAKTLDALKHVQAVKVIQEIFDPEEGLSKEFSIYSSDKGGGPPKKSAPKNSKKKGKKRDAGDPVRREIKIKKSEPKLPLDVMLVRMSGIVAFSCVIGAMFTWFASMVLTDSSISVNAQYNILFIVFLIVFVISAIPMAIVFLGKEK